MDRIEIRRTSTRVGRQVQKSANARRSLRGILRTPGATREAFLLHEVFGPPISVRSCPFDRPF